jgi:hypothetical protein
VLLLHRKLQSASNFLMSYCFLLFVLNIADGFGRCADYRRHSEIARFLAHSLSRNLMARLRRWSSSR